MQDKRTANTRNVTTNAPPAEADGALDGTSGCAVQAAGGRLQEQQNYEHQEEDDHRSHRFVDRRDDVEEHPDDQGADECDDDRDDGVFGLDRDLGEHCEHWVPLILPSLGLKGMKATYDADHHVLYIMLPDRPGTPGSVGGTEVHEDCDSLLYDIDGDGKLIAIEVILSEPLDVGSGELGGTRTGNAIQLPTHEVRASQIHTDNAANALRAHRASP